MNGRDIDVFSLLVANDVFRELPVETMRSLALAARVERYDQRTLLVPQGHTPEHLRYVVEGSVDLTQSTPEGRYTTLPILAGNWATWLGCFSEQPLPHEIWTSKTATYIALPTTLVHAAVSINTKALLAVIKHIADVNRALIAWTLGATLFAPEKRICFMLLVLSGAGTSRPPNSEQTPITQEQIGHLGFGSRQRVARLLRNLESRGLIEMRYGAVTVPSWPLLREFVSNPHI